MLLLVSSAAGFVAVEAGVETAISQETNDDLIAGRTVARGFGEIANFLGYDGGLLTQELIEGKTVKSQAFTAVIGYLQNLGINVGMNRLAQFLPGAKPEVKPQDAKAQQSINDLVEPPYRATAEPTDVITADTATPTSKPSANREFINEDTLRQELLTSKGLDPDGLTAANRIHFDNLDRVKSLSGMEQLLDEASRASGKILNNAPKQRREAIDFARRWWSDNASLIDEGAYDSVSLNFAADMTRTLDSKVGQQALVNPDIDKYLKEYAETTGSGSLAAALVGESMGLKGIKLATIASNLDSVGIDFTKTVDEFAQLVDKAELFRIPELRSSRNWHLTGELKQRRALKDAGRADVIEPGKGRAASADAPSAEFETKIEGSSFRQLWERAKDGDAGALQTVKQTCVQSPLCLLTKLLERSLI